MTTSNNYADGATLRAAARVIDRRTKPTFLWEWIVARLNKLADQIERGEK